MPIIFTYYRKPNLIVNPNSEGIAYPRKGKEVQYYFALSYFIFLRAFVYRGRIAHTVLWCRLVFACLCVVFTLGRLACFGFIELQCTP